MAIPKMPSMATMVAVAAVTIASLMGFTAGGCSAGQTARQELLLPAMTGLWFSDGVEDDIQLGINAAVSAGEITPEDAAGWRGAVASISAAIKSEDRTAVSAYLSTHWAQLRLFAEQGVWSRVAAGELSAADYNDNGVPDFVESYIERLDNYEAEIPVIGEKPNDN